VVALNRAVAVAQVSGPAAALELLNDLDLGRYQLYHAIRADLLRRLDRAIEARDAYQAAITLTDNPSERRFLQRRLHALTAQKP
jgi:RNA polymerase sigma-70 factor (ECF subfamily)